MKVFIPGCCTEQGASAATTGVDLSAAMIDLARAQEAADPQGIDYAVADAATMSFEKPFDAVVAAYLLNYAHDRTELAAMCWGLARSLRPGGRFVTVNGSPLLDFHRAPSFRKYGFETAMAVGPVEGAPITWTFHLPDGTFSIENYFLDRQAHEEALRAAGFREIRWHSPKLDPAGLERFGAQLLGRLLVPFAHRTDRVPSANARGFSFAADSRSIRLRRTAVWRCARRVLDWRPSCLANTLHQDAHHALPCPRVERSAPLVRDRLHE